MSLYYSHMLWLNYYDISEILTDPGTHPEKKVENIHLSVTSFQITK